ncbi:MAG: A/G-specific adenine glycosylase [bacterium]|nr:A/G-specific adenine glycosylase [bacterium]
MTIPEFQKIILSWHVKNRRDMPWRKTRNPYKILVSEIMLQQTQVSRVTPKYKEFLKEFPTLVALAKTSDAKLLRVWQGLGYWRRARFLKATAQAILKKHKGVFPKEPEVLEKLPGIGHYTARAIACFAFNNAEAFLDTNIRRVYLHFFFPKRTDVPDTKVLRMAQEAVWKKNPREWHYALFDYGAMVLKDKGINKRSQHYTKQSKFEGSFRSFRTKAMKLLLQQKENRVRSKTLDLFLKRALKTQRAPHSAKEVIDSLLKDKLVKKSGTYFYL